MMTTPNDKLKRLQGLLDELEDTILTASDEDILQEICETGEELESTVTKVSGVIDLAIKDTRQQKLRDARTGYRQALQSTLPIVPDIPEDAAQRRALLESVLANKGAVPKEVTMAFREGRDLSDEDVKTLLEDLAALGLLGDKKDPS